MSEIKEPARRLQLPRELCANAKSASQRTFYETASKLLASHAEGEKTDIPVQHCHALLRPAPYTYFYQKEGSENEEEKPEKKQRKRKDEEERDGEAGKVIYLTEQGGAGKPYAYPDGKLKLGAKVLAVNSVTGKGVRGKCFKRILLIRDCDGKGFKPSTGDYERIDTFSLFHIAVDKTPAAVPPAAPMPAACDPNDNPHHELLEALRGEDDQLFNKLITFEPQLANHKVYMPGYDPAPFYRPVVTQVLSKVDTTTTVDSAYYKMVQCLLNNRADLEAYVPNGSTPIFEASYRGNILFVKLRKRHACVPP